MPVFYNTEHGNYPTAKSLLLARSQYQNKDGYYFLRPGGINSSGKLVYCDMTTDGGGWMLIARSHPTGDVSPSSWGWRGKDVGSVKDFTKPYQASWHTNWSTNSQTFSDFIFGNRKNINTNEWGPFVFKQNITAGYATWYPTDALNYTAPRTVLKEDRAIYDNSQNPYPPMQQMYGFQDTGTASNIYYLRDCCGYANFGMKPNFMQTTYLGHPTLFWYSGPWGAGSTTDGSGNFTQSTGNVNLGGTNQYMMMVR